MFYVWERLKRVCPKTGTSSSKKVQRIILKRSSIQSYQVFRAIESIRCPICLFAVTKDISTTTIGTTDSSCTRILLWGVRLRLLRRAKSEKSQERQDEHGFSKKILHYSIDFVCFYFLLFWPFCASRAEWCMALRRRGGSLGRRQMCCVASPQAASASIAGTRFG